MPANIELTEKGYFEKSNIAKKNMKATVYDEYRPIWAKPKKYLNPNDELLKSENSSIKVIEIKNKVNEKVWIIEAEKYVKINVELNYYPGWKVYSDGKEVPIEINSNGTFCFFLRKGVSKVQIVFEETILREISNFLSFAGILMFAIVVLRLDEKTE